MKTQIVYIIVSDETDTYLEQAMVSVYSLRLYNSEAKVILVTDLETNSTLSGNRAGILDYISEKRVIEIPGVYSKMQRSRYLKTTLRNNIQGNFLYMDTDTFIMRDLTDVDSLTMDIGAVLDMTMPSRSVPSSLCNQFSLLGLDPREAKDSYFNSGVIFVRDVPLCYRLYQEWHDAWLESIGKGLNRDQPALTKADYACGNVIQQLPYIWNCQITPSHARNYRDNAYILHYFGSIYDMPKMANIPRELNELLMQVGDKFPPKLSIPINYKEEELLRSSVALLFRKNHRKMFSIFEWMSTLLMKIKGERD